MTRILKLVLVWGAVLWLGANAAAAEDRYASIVVDADSLEIIHARQIDEARYPASLTKVMTLVLVFDALETGTLSLGTEMRVSKTAAGVSPTKLGLKAGSTITVDDAIQGIAVKSANDAAIVVAEHLGGSVEGFAEMMNARARGLGMVSTTFHTPNGLPHPEQLTTARDMAKLAHTVLSVHPRHYHYFGQTRFTYKGRTYKNTNALLHWLAGVDGFKTGFTNDSGYNLIISAKRPDANGLDRRIIAVVLGGASGKSRNTHMQDLIERAFDTLGLAPVESQAPVAVAKVERAPLPDIEKPDIDEPGTKKPAEIIRLRGRNSEPMTIVTRGAPTLAASVSAAPRPWSIQVGTHPRLEGARDQLSDLVGLGHIGLGRDNAVIQPRPNGATTVYSARFTGLNLQQAQASCRALKSLDTGCRLVAPGG